MCRCLSRRWTLSKSWELKWYLASRHYHWSVSKRPFYWYPCCELGRAFWTLPFSREVSESVLGELWRMILSSIRAKVVEGSKQANILIIYIWASTWTVIEKCQCSFIMPESKLPDAWIRNSHSIIDSGPRPIKVFQGPHTGNLILETGLALFEALFVVFTWEVKTPMKQRTSGYGVAPVRSLTFFGLTHDREGLTRLGARFVITGRIPRVPDKLYLALSESSTFGIRRWRYYWAFPAQSASLGILPVINTGIRADGQSERWAYEDWNRRSGVDPCDKLRYIARWSCASNDIIDC